jgi:CBS domain-containing protein
MWDHDLGCLTVRGGDGQALGMLTDRDICMAAFTRDKPLAEIPVLTSMSREVVSCTEEDSIIQAEDLMRSHQVRRLPVLGLDGTLVGIISLSDIAREAEAELGRQGRQISPQEVTATLADISRRRGAGGMVRTS